MSSLKHVASISSVSLSSLAALFAFQREGWCPVGRIAMHVVALAVCAYTTWRGKKGLIQVSYTDEQELSNAAFLDHSRTTGRRFGIVAINTVNCTAFSVNACIVCAWIISTVVQRTEGDSFFILVFLMYACNSLNLRMFSAFMAMLGVYMHGVPHITQCGHALCIVACIWLCRFPQASGVTCGICLLAWWLAMLIMDGVATCTSLTAAMPPLLPCILAVRKLHARPVIMLLILCSIDWF